MIGNGGADILSGADGNDTFLFALGFGKDTIRDFGDASGNQDFIEFSSAVFAGFNDVQQHMQQVGADVVITHDPTGDTVTVKNMMVANLGADDFLFV